MVHYYSHIAFVSASQLLNWSNPLHVGEGSQSFHGNLVLYQRQLDISPLTSVILQNWRSPLGERWSIFKKSPVAYDIAIRTNPITGTNRFWNLSALSPVIIMSFKHVFSSVHPSSTTYRKVSSIFSDWYIMLTPLIFALDGVRKANRFCVVFINWHRGSKPICTLWLFLSINLSTSSLLSFLICGCLCFMDLNFLTFLFLHIFTYWMLYVQHFGQCELFKMCF